MKTAIKRIAAVVSFSALAVACERAPSPSTGSIAASASAPPKPVPTASTPVAVQPFEGDILVSVKADASKKLPLTIDYEVKANKVRYVPAAAPLVAVGDLDAQLVYAIDDARKSYETLDMRLPRNEKPAPLPKVQKTGKLEKIAGVDCEDWTVDDGTEKVDVCAWKGVAFFGLAADAKPGSTEAPWERALTEEKAFPLRVVAHDKVGKEEYRAEATTATRKKIDDALFQLPSGYRKADLKSEMKAAALW
jgi:hypothetical protein